LKGVKTMTVKELIEELKCYEEDKVVWICVHDHYKLVHEVDLDETVGEEDLVIR
jgi:hypothetical protein